MSKMEEIGQLQTRELKAREGYRETGDPKFLKMMLDCLKEREKLLFKHLPVPLVKAQMSDK